MPSWDDLYVAAPENTQWPLDLDTAEARLRERFPDAIVTRRHGAVSGMDYIRFEAAVAGAARHGIYVAGQNLTVSDGQPSDWADTIEWFLSLLPSGTPALAMTEHNQNLTPIPSGATRGQLVALYEDLITNS